MDPPVSDPRVAMHSSMATAAAEPPEEPPGMRVLSHGLRVVKKAEFSVELPMANSSILRRPKTMAPAARSFSTTVASYGETKFARIFEPQLHGCPLTQSTSLRA